MTFYFVRVKGQSQPCAGDWHVEEAVAIETAHELSAAEAMRHVPECEFEPVKIEVTLIKEKHYDNPRKSPLLGMQQQGRQKVQRVLRHRRRKKH